MMIVFFLFFLSFCSSSTSNVFSGSSFSIKGDQMFNLNRIVINNYIKPIVWIERLDQ
ncbi:hypothetical protein ECANGB1_2665 [Enterospora canceri]|uniref:Uncharacterized protein n=1 Tax=Enterospora canceri TaxID=1081671 RepID=A0A1Y1S5H5_9MICR|nr:hypothetical protein ECANGB1_2665 [Enterospora canceri]